MLQLLSHAATESKQILSARRHFFAKSLVDVTSFLNEGVVNIVRDEVDRLSEQFGRRRDLRIKSTGDTPRRMNNVEYRYIAQNSELLRNIYFDERLRQFLSQLAGEPVVICPYDPEKMVITRLTQTGDSHGWHWDDYSFAMIWVLEAPEPEKGGVLQCVPNTYWDRADPQIIAQFLMKPITTYYFPSGSVYLMRSDTTLHRVYPITGSSARRTILNITYAAPAEINKPIDHSSMEELFSPAREMI